MSQVVTEIKGYHAHVYYDVRSRDAAERVRKGLGDLFNVVLGRWHDVPVGPHPKAMYQVAFTPDEFAKVVPWLMFNREALDILIHPSTGEHIGDHRDRSLWLGTPLPLRLGNLN